MQNISFEDGYKSFSINGDESKVIRFNPSDISIIERINQAYKSIEKAMNTNEDIALNPDGSPESDLDQAAELVKGINNTIKEQINYIFNSPVSDMVFGNQSPLGMVKGVPLYERFLNAVVPVIEKELKVEIEASKKRVSKYTSQVKRK